MFNDCKSQHKEDNGLKCFKKCEFCNEPNTSRTVDLDMFFGRDDDVDGAEAHYEPADPGDIEAIVEDTALLSTLNAALAALSQEDRDLIRDIFWHGKTERQLAPQLGLKEPKSVNKRKHRILEILRQNKALKEFLD
jgi:DNA-directed RNA polymerase specialized sigma24 family protein